MRLLNSLRNLAAAWAGELFVVLLTFIGRYAFVNTLGTTYLGISGLFSTILSMLSLAELGVATAIAFSLYRPLAEDNRELIKSIMHTYRMVYRIIGTTIAVIGSALTPFLNFFIDKHPDVPHLELYYLLFVLNTAVGYFWSYKGTLITADQKNFIVKLNYSLFMTIQTALQIAVLYLTENYILYLVIMVLCTVGKNFFLSRKADKLYPYLREKNVQKLDENMRHSITRNIFGTMFHKLGAVIVKSTDNILISKYVGLVAVGLYSNYYAIINAINMLLQEMFNAIVASIGNFNISATTRQMRELLKKTMFVNFWTSAFCSICLTCLLTPFVRIWLGSQYVMDSGVVLVLGINFYLNTMRATVLKFRNAIGLYWEDRWNPVIQSLTNLIASIILVKTLGLIGVFIGTTISIVLVCVWWEPYVLYRYGFHTSILPYFGTYGAYLLLYGVTTAVTWWLCSLVPVGGFASFLGCFAISVTVPNLIFLLVLHRRPEFKFCLETVRSAGKSLQKKKKTDGDDNNE